MNDGELSREHILDCDDHKIVSVSVPEWGGTVYVRTLTGAERDALEMSVRDGSMINFRARFAVAVCCSSTGEAMFSVKDIDGLTSKSAAALNRIMDAGLTLNGMDAAAVDRAEKNSESAPSGASGSNLPDTSA